MRRALQAIIASVVVAVILGGCRQKVTFPVYECVWTSCSAKTLVMNRCASLADLDSPAFVACMRYEGYERRACPSEKPECWTGVKTVR